MAGETSQPSVDAVLLCAHGAGRSTSGPGTWGALLLYGEHHRTIQGAERETTLGRMQLLSVIRGLECLTRPSSVHIRILSEEVREGVAGLKANPRTLPAENADLWRRLVSATGPHEIEWSWDRRGVLHEARELREAVETRLLENELGDDGGVGEVPVPSVGAELTRFLDEQHGRHSDSTVKAIGEFLGDLREGIDAHTGEETVDALPANAITTVLWSAYEGWSELERVSPGHLLRARAIVPFLLRWFRDQGHISERAAESHAEKHRDVLSGYLAVREFVFALDDVHESPSRDAYPDEWMENLKFTIEKVEETSIALALRFEPIVIDEAWDTFEPTTTMAVDVPAEVAALAEPGWTLVASAVDPGGEWMLADVVGGTPNQSLPAFIWIE